MKTLNKGIEIIFQNKKTAKAKEVGERSEEKTWEDADRSKINKLQK